MNRELPTQTELLLPLLHVLEENGPMRAREAADAVADKLSLPPEVRDATITYRHGAGFKTANLFARRVRWVKQTAVGAELIKPVGIWELAEAGHKTLTQARVEGSIGWPIWTGYASYRAVASIRKQFGEGSVFRLGAGAHMNVEALSTGNPAIDLALGIGGLPIGRLAEIYGPESSGKTTFCLSVIAECQRRGGVAAFIDVEHAVDPKYARTVGVRLDELLISQPDCGDDALNITETLIRSDAIDVIVIDSVAALISRSELSGEMGDQQMGSQARLMSQAMRRLTAVVSKTKCVCIFTNQIREKIGVMFGSPETTPGGRALKFFSSIRIDIRRKDQIKTAEGKVIGNRVKIKVVKNKVAPPFTECEFDIMYDEGISRSGSVIDLGLAHNVLEKKGSWIAYDGALIGQGRDAAKQVLKDKPELSEQITKAVIEKAKAGVRTDTGSEDPVALAGAGETAA